MATLSRHKRRTEGPNKDEIIAKIIFEETLPERCRPHNLSGNWSNFTECHVLNDWALIYRYTDGGVVFARAGTHSDLL
jgi:mRNA interferase YafQ